MSADVLQGIVLIDVSSASLPPCFALSPPYFFAALSAAPWSAAETDSLLAWSSAGPEVISRNIQT